MPIWRTDPAQKVCPSMSSRRPSMKSRGIVTLQKPSPMIRGSDIPQTSIQCAIQILRKGYISLRRSQKRQDAECDLGHERATCSAYLAFIQLSYAKIMRLTSKTSNLIVFSSARCRTTFTRTKLARARLYVTESVS